MSGCCSYYVNLATFVSFDPPSIPAASNRFLKVSGAGMPSLSGDGMAFLVSATSCSNPTALNPMTLASTSATNVWNSPTSITVALNASGAQTGVFRLCLRWNTTLPYIDAGPLSISAVSSIAPYVISACSVVQSVLLTGEYLANVTADASAFVISLTNCTSPTSVVSSVSFVYNSAISIQLIVNDSGASSGVYSICLRMSSTSAYWDTQQTIIIGIVFPRCIISPNCTH